MVWTAISNNIKINTVYIGGQNNNKLLENIAEQTRGQYFKAVTADELIGIYSEIIVDQRIDNTDTDGDGFKFGVMPEYHLNNLAWWDGDLQTAMN